MMRKILIQALKILLLMSIVAAGMALYLGLRWLIDGPFVPTEAVVIWFWDNLVVYADENRWFDPLIVALWSVIPIALLFDRPRYCDLHLAPLFGLCASGGIHLAFWGEPGVAFWPLMAPVALILSRVFFLLSKRQANLDRKYLSYSFGNSYVSLFMYDFGLGMLLPLAVMHGFYLATIVWWAYSLVSLVISLLIFGPQYLFHIVRWLHNRLLRKRKTNQTATPPQAKDDEP
ncbi:MAG: hypothetical protein V1738_01990 [Patescibacteria group bacterium]